MAYAVFDHQSPSEAPDFGVRTERFRPAERLIVVLGAAALGCALGVGATIALGSLEPWMVAACAAPFYMAALHFASEGCRDAINRRAWTAAGVAVLLLAGLAAWPIAVFYAPAQTPLFWIGPAATLTTLAAFVVIMAGEQRNVFRASAIAALIAVLAANQSFLTAMGS